MKIIKTEKTEKKEEKQVKVQIIQGGNKEKYYMTFNEQSVSNAKQELTDIINKKLNISPIPTGNRTQLRIREYIKNCKDRTRMNGKAISLSVQNTTPKEVYKIIIESFETITETI